ncbi:hypothetical protein ACFQ88_38985 [Paenibacillus sp. NPDC056579]|uniref:hypothetical protein n=1 Tax=Paenibacillus sp. NPDC056579 TaxID=3345871 RepID=UPI00369BB003
MGKIIVAFAIIPFLLFFMLQYVVDTTNHYKMTRVNDIVHKSAQTARTTGYFTPQIISQLKRELAAALYIPESSVIVTATTTPKYRLDEFDQREMIQYEVKVPFDQVIAAPSLFGISDTDNRLNYVKKGEVASEVLMP